MANPEPGRSGARTLLLIVAIATIAVTVTSPLTAGQNAVVRAQGARPGNQEGNLGLPDSPRNLQVLPEDMSTRAVVGVMRGFASALGVRCIHCHVGDDPNDLSTIDFVSDERQAKRVARVMMRMLQTVNDDMLEPGLAEVGRTDALAVRCATCHHGNNRPVSLGEVLATELENDGVDAMLARYDSLRAENYGGWAYDFSEGALLRLAGRLARTGNIEAAMAAIDKNLEFHPESATTRVTQGQLLAQAGEFERAKDAFQACLEADPELAFCQQMIDRIDQREQ